ncbi:MAG TPA: TIGR03435 family protein, partial [Candidatus Sulfotelmatobacter sp.]|nr:TIGR03435 family protein [Candidatus Sulfotelmatobacter sp.]
VLPQHLLEVGENGSKLQPTKYADSPDTAAGSDGKAIHRMLMREGDDGQVMSIEAQKSSMAELARQLSMQLGENVVDKTGLAGQYDFNLQWAQSAGNDSLFTAVQEQLGLKLVPQQAPSDALVIDHVELPEMDASR